MTLKNGFFREHLQLNKTILKNGPFRLFWKIGFFVLFAFLISISIYIINFSFSNNGLNLFFESLKDFFSPSSFSSTYNHNLFYISFTFLWNSIKLVFLSTFFGFIFAFLTAYLSNMKTNSKYIAIPVKVFVIFLRIFPELFFIYLFKISFDKNLAISLIYCWFTWLWLHEYFSQTIENANFNIFYHISKAKNSKFKAFWIEIWPQIRKKFISYYFYAFETNLRWSAILANLGYLGMGILINPQENPVNYSQLLVPLFVLVSFLFLLEIISEYFKKFFFVSKSTNDINFKKYNSKKIIKRILALFFIIVGIVIAVITIQNLTNQHFHKTETIHFFKKMFQGYWGQITWNFSNDGIFWILLQLSSLVFLTFILVYIISYFRMMLMTKKLVGKPVEMFYKYFNIFIRSIPAVILFLLISNLFNEFSAAFVFAFAIHSSASLSRNLYQTINNVSETKISELKKLKYSNFWIYRNYIRPKIKLDFITFSSFELEKITRNFITYGSLSSSLLGQKANLSRAKDIGDISPYLWIGFIIIAFINLFTYLLRVKLTKQKWI
ncbi:ABC transporter permease [Mycoplasmopsis arginini]|uniref:ABC transporter permease n=2 Tax=Mycoplasmopsis arginini TaxID=2094 RepID=UPI00249DC16C|nr:ABC transporter permease [Mycoplasmopsis arginini]MDI3348525.1 hypothetical protein [Mycoplasmopsis arginini]MDI3351624.1 hypothetical protein [Mycoplasmopsis arginini]MDI3352161.1 hypothetical protein [Mycoplasmopsis arginini]